MNRGAFRVRTATRKKDWMAEEGILFVSYHDTIELLSIDDVMRICEDVLLMHARDTVTWSRPPTMILEETVSFHNHWHVKAILLKDIPVSAVRVFNFYNDGVRSTVGQLDCTRFVMLTDPRTSKPMAIVDEHLSFGMRAAAGAVLPCKWLGPASPKVLGISGTGTIATNCLKCLLALYQFDEIRVTSRRKESRRAFAGKWSNELGIEVRPVDTVEEVARDADIIVGATTSLDVMCREEWVKPGATFISLARKELDPDGWTAMDKIVIDNWDANVMQTVFREMVEAGQISQAQIYAETPDIASGAKKGRERDDERILIHTTGLVSQDVAIAHFLFVEARERGLGTWLPSALAATG